MGTFGQFITSPSKKAMIFLKVFSVLILVAGMGLILKGLGISHSESWPLWIKIKLGLWFVFVIGVPVSVKRLGLSAKVIFPIGCLIILMAAYLGVYKPF